MTLLLAAALLAQETGDLDVLTLKDGTTRSGRVVSETPTHLVLETLILGSKKQVVGSVKVSVDRAQVVSVRFASEEARRKAASRAEAFGTRGLRRAEALARIRMDEANLDGLRGFRVEGSHFRLESSCDPAFTKDVALCLEEVFAAYRKAFDIRRNADRKVKVHLFDSAEAYAAFQTRRHGAAVMNPAYYHLEQNYIAAYNVIQKAEERRIRAETLALQSKIETYRADLASAEKRVGFLVDEIRQGIQGSAEGERRAIRADAEGGKDARLQAVDRRERELLDQLRNEATDVQKELVEERKKASEGVEAARQVIERNERILAAQNRAMFETLFHEGFHAFAANYLWEGGGQKEFPRWLHEGMAAYFEVSSVEGAEFIHGAAHPGFLAICREESARSGLLPVEKILTAGPERFLVTHRSEAARSGLYYAESWALAHYLSSRVSRERIAAYVGEVLGGADPVKAFESLAGKSCLEVEAELKKHLDGLR